MDSSAQREGATTLDEEILAPDGRCWHVPLPPYRDRVIFYRPFGTSWLLYGFAQGEQEAAHVLSSIALQHGSVETAIVVLGTGGQPRPLGYSP